MFNIGDTVELKSGGPCMTVTEVLDNGRVHCSWFVDHTSTELSTTKLKVEAIKSITLSNTF